MKQVNERSKMLGINIIIGSSKYLFMQLIITLHSKYFLLRHTSKTLDGLMKTTFCTPITIQVYSKLNANLVHSNVPSDGLLQVVGCKLVHQFVPRLCKNAFCNVGAK